MNAQDVVDKIGRGVGNALKTSQLFLGVEQIEFENANIHPEYLTTVKVAESLTGPSVVVSLETHMKHIRDNALAICRLRNWKSQIRVSQIAAELKEYRFGKKDSERLDILVRPSDDLLPPHLFVEAKLGMRDVGAVKTDVHRILKLLCMYENTGEFQKDAIYGAVVFHLMKEGADAIELQTKANEFLAELQAYFLTLQAKLSWLRWRCELISSWQIAEEVAGYREVHPDGSIEAVFGKDKFSFAPGLMLFGAADDIDTATF